MGFQGSTVVSPNEKIKITGRAGYFFRQMTRTEEVPEATATSQEDCVESGNQRRMMSFRWLIPLINTTNQTINASHVLT